jgi:cytochrome c biogenesis protein CcmG/thiol:disulfide interchange protein DsbE
MRRFALPTAIVVVAAALVGLLVYGLAQKATSRTLDDAVAHRLRPPAPVATLPLLSGSGRQSLIAYRGKVVVLNFWASWCDPCKAEAPMLESAQRQLLAHRATVLGVTDLDLAPDSRSFVARYGLTYPNLRDVDGNLSHSYGTNQLPETFVIDRQGRVAAISRGEVDQPFLNRAVALAEAS